MSQEIIGLQRVLSTSGSGQTWNNKLIRWTIIHNINNQTKPYDIQLQMVLLSSKRIVRVNNQIKDTQMCSFGYDAKFQIGETLKGQIKQDSLAFQLYVNGQSFTQIQKFNNTYQPPKLNLGGKDVWDMNNQQKAQKIDKKSIFQKHQFRQQKVDKVPEQKISTKALKTHSFTQNSASKVKTTQHELPSQKASKVKTTQHQLPTPKLTVRPVSSELKEEKKATESVIKDTQNELMRILMEQKKRKKEEQKVKQSKG